MTGGKSTPAAPDLYAKSITGPSGETYSIDNFYFRLWSRPQPAERISEAVEALNVKAANFALAATLDPCKQTFARPERMSWGWQFGDLRIRLYGVKHFADLTHIERDEDGAGSVTKHIRQPSGLFQLEFVLQFNPNKVGQNPVLRDLLGWIQDGRLACWATSRVDYAVDFPCSFGEISAVSRKKSGFIGTTRYYGQRSTSGFLRNYDKRAEVLKNTGRDLGVELTRFEWEQHGNIDFQFPFDKLCRWNFDALQSSALALALSLLDDTEAAKVIARLNKRTRARVQNECRFPVQLCPENWRILLRDYFADFGLDPLDRVDDSVQDPALALVKSARAVSATGTLPLAEIDFDKLA